MFDIEQTLPRPRPILYLPMSFDNAYTRTINRAIATMGSADQLATALGASVAEVQSWAGGIEDPPPGIFLKAIDIVAKAWPAPHRTLKL
jgi:hypothetical protein